MALKTEHYQPGTRVRVTQQVAKRDETWTNTVEGTIARYEQSKTGSWFAHSKDDHLWLDRLELRLDDGELVLLNLDQFSHIEPIATPPEAPPDAAPETRPGIPGVPGALPTNPG